MRGFKQKMTSLPLLAVALFDEWFPPTPPISACNGELAADEGANFAMVVAHEEGGAKPGCGWQMLMGVCSGEVDCSVWKYCGFMCLWKIKDCHEFYVFSYMVWSQIEWR